jgi:hypothetical protein
MVPPAKDQRESDNAASPFCDTDPHQANTKRVIYEKDLEKVKLLSRDLRGASNLRAARVRPGRLRDRRAVDKCRASSNGKVSIALIVRSIKSGWSLPGSTTMPSERSFPLEQPTQLSRHGLARKPRSALAEVIAWNNKQRELRLSELPPELQEYMEDYIAKFVPRDRVVYRFFDVYASRNSDFERT